MVSNPILFPGEQEILAIRDLVKAGLFLQAYRAAEGIAPLNRWSGARALTLAGLLTDAVGDSKRGAALQLRAYRADRDDPEARYYAARQLLARTGPYLGWRLLQRLGPPTTGDDDDRAEWQAMLGFAAGLLRDFATADLHHREAAAIAPESPWILVERAAVLAMDDRPEEALEAARRSLSLRSDYAPAVSSVAGYLTRLGRQAEAVATLEDACGRLECARLLSQLMVMHGEAENWDSLAALFERFRELLPLMDEARQEWLAGSEARVAYARGDYEAAREWSSQSDHEYHRKVAENMANAAEDARQVLLPVPFVLQQYLTCAPATLAAIAHYWDQPTEHLEIADEICYDGTPHFLQREWASRNGWLSREFTVTWESGQALIDCGIPFTLTTTAINTAHMQAVMGYDTRRGIFIIRDPGTPHQGHALAAELLESQQGSGPRGMALAVEGSTAAATLAGMDLPESRLYDVAHRFYLALEHHRRAEAVAGLVELDAEAPESSVTLQAHYSLAAYDQDLPSCIQALDRLQDRFPKDPGVKFRRTHILRQMGRRQEWMAVLEAEARQKDAAGPWRSLLASELSADIHRRDEAELLLRRELRHRGVDATTLGALGNLRWLRRDFDQGIEIYRFALCMENTDEDLAVIYFRACRQRGRAAEAETFLRDRHLRAIHRSSLPTQTYAWMLSELDRAHEALQVLDEAVQRFPNDGPLLLYAAQHHSVHGREARARELLEAARGKSRLSAWAEAAARLAGARGEATEALELLRQVVAAEPLNVGAQEDVARLLYSLEGPQAAIAHLRRESERFPQHVALRRAWAEWATDTDPASAEEALRGTLAHHPGDGRSHFMLAHLLLSSGRVTEAWEHAEPIRHCEGESSNYHYLHGRLLESEGRIGEAREAYRQGVRKDVDNSSVIQGLFRVSDTAEQRREALAIVRAEIELQPVSGSALRSMAEVMPAVVSSEVALEFFREAWQRLPHQADAWWYYVGKLVEHHRLGEALEVATAFCDRFPLLTSAWVCLGRVHEARREPAESRKALEEALRIQPGLDQAARRLSRLLEEAGEPAEARRVIEHAIRHNALDPDLHAHLAYVLWEQSEFEAAVERLTHVLRLAPSYGWAWDQMMTWCPRLGRPEQPLQLASELASARPRDVELKLILGRLLPTADERFAVLREALSMNPRHLQVRQQLIGSLSQAGRFDEAQALAREPESPSIELRGSDIWIEAQRGNRDAAIDQMHALLAEAPTFTWGSLHLMSWLENAERYEEILPVTDGLLRVEPSNAEAWELRGRALEKLDRREEAVAAYEKALDSDAEAHGALVALCRIHVDAGEDAKAVSSVQESLERRKSDQVLQMAITLAIRAGNKDEAVARLAELCDECRWRADSLEPAVDEIHEAGWSREAYPVLTVAVKAPGAHPMIGHVWGKTEYRLFQAKGGDGLEELLEVGPCGIAAAASFLHQLIDHGMQQPTREFLRRHASILGRDSSLMEAAARAYTMFGEAQPILELQSDWQGRTDLEGWMLTNLGFALRVANRTQEAACLSQEMLRRMGGPRRAPHHAVWAFTDAVEAGRHDEARILRTGIPAGELWNEVRFVMALADAELLAATAVDPAAALREAKGVLSAADAEYPPKAWTLFARTLHDRALRRILARIPTPPAYVWYAWRKVRCSRFIAALN